MAFLIDLAIRATVLFGAAALVVWLMRRDSAASRHAIWLGFFCSVALLPLGATALPRLRIAVLAAPTTVAASVRSSASAQTSVPSATVPSPATTPDSAALMPLAARTGWPIGTLMLSIWLIGAGCLGARMAVGAAGVRRLRRRAQPVGSAEVLDLIEGARQRLDVRRRITVLSADDDVMPLTWGVRQPVVLLPSSAVSAVRPAGLEAVIFHEVAHIARLDAPAQLVSQLVTAMLWFHPLMWVALRSARVECERACDDVALRQGIRPTDYAMELLMLVRSLRPMNSLALGVLGAARRSQLDRRIRRILQEGANRRRASVVSVVTAAALLTIAPPLAATHLTARSTARLPPAVAGAVALQLPEVNHETGRLRLPAGPTLRFGATAPPADVSPQTVVYHETVQAEIPWHAERAELYQRLLRLAQDLLASCRTQIQIGTMAQLDLKEVQQTIGRLRELALQADASQIAASQVAAPTSTERADLRARFADAQRTLEVDQTKFAVGLLSLRQFDTDLIDAGQIIAVHDSDGAAQLPAEQMPDRTLRIVVTDQSGVVRLPFEVKRFTLSDPTVARVSAISPNQLQIEGQALGRATLTIWGDTAQIRYQVDVEHLSRVTADFESQLQFALTRPTDALRAEALLALARANVFTPEMVERYVAAVSRLTAVERDRVLAQPIHVKPSGG